VSSNVTIKQIARRLNISASSVSRALHDHPSIGYGTRIRVKQLAKELNYERNLTAIHFQKGKTFMIGVVLPDLTETFFSKAISGIEDIAVKSNYSVMFGQSHNSEDREKEIVNTMKRQRVDGLIVSIAKNTENYDHFEMLRKQGIPIFFFDCIPDLDNINYVACDMASGAENAVNFLLHSGHRVIGMLNGPEKLLASRQRVDGYCRALQKHSIAYDPALLIHTDLSTKGTATAMKTLLSLKRKLTAVVVFNDYSGLDAIRMVRERQGKGERKLTFVSCGTGAVMDTLRPPILASLEQFPYRQGEKAVESLLSLLGGPMSNVPSSPLAITMESQLIINNRQ
jgi:LacI family transcriptional regulator